MYALKSIRTLLRNNDGAAAVEFALVAVPFFLMFMGTLEFGLISMTRVAIEGATTQVARNGAVGSATPGCDRVCTVKGLVEQKTSGLINADAVTVTATVVASGSTASTAPDICLVDSSNPYPATCVTAAGDPGPFENNDGVTDYQQSASLTAASIGNAGELVEIRVTYPWRVLFPIFAKYFGDNGVLTISATTLVKNEQF